MQYDALLLVSFGGPETREDVIPFLENVLRGKNVPRERMMEVAEHYYHFDGHSPINRQNRELIALLTEELARSGPKLSVYWGNRNWHPLLTHTVEKMKSDGVQRALAFVTSAYSSYSGCRQYRENIVAAQERAGPGAPRIDKLRVFYNHPNYIEATIERVQEALLKIPAGLREGTRIIYTAHSIPLSMAQTCNYVVQLEEVRRLVSEGLRSAAPVLGKTGPQPADDCLVYQSRSGPPAQPWLGPDILDYLRELKRRNSHPAVVIAPIGFTSDHMEVLYDLDTEAKSLCEELQLTMVRAATVGTHPKLISMVRELIVERMEQDPVRRALGSLGPWHDSCPGDCCPPLQRPAAGART